MGKGHEIDEGVIYWQIEYDDGDAEDFEEADLGMAFALYEKNEEFDEIGKNGSSEPISVDDDNNDKEKKTPSSKNTAEEKEVEKQSNTEEENIDDKKETAQDAEAPDNSEGTEITRLLV